MTNLQILQIIVAIMVILSVLIQNKSGGLSATFGGRGETFRSRRGAEKGLFYVTILLVATLLILSITNFYLSQ